jgi:2-polyprenyl-3-methyl-5-hydroxy-6-metoxy-1,4-benzoquinol methylase
MPTHANPDVLAFYKALPFNYRASVADHVKSVQRLDVATGYPMLARLLRKGVSVLEVGCGIGWLSSSMAYRYGCDVTAIDFNPVAVERAREIASAMALPVTFSVADLFLYEPEQPADVVLSFGVLHHTNNCAAALRRCFERFAAPSGHVVVGLNHAFGRKPFLEHFARLQASGASEDQMLAEYGRLHTWITDPTHLMSWFRDQVLHPHETQHTLREIVGVAEEAGFRLVSTSINRFGPVTDLDGLYRAEADYERIGRDRLREGTYFPGFFIAEFTRR